MCDRVEEGLETYGYVLWNTSEGGMMMMNIKKLW